MRTITIDLYKFEELSEKAKAFAIKEYRQLFCDGTPKEEFIETCENEDCYFFQSGVFFNY